MRDEGLCCQYVLAQKEYYFHLLLPCLAQGGYAKCWTTRVNSLERFLTELFENRFYFLACIRSISPDTLWATRCHVCLVFKVKTAALLNIICICQFVEYTAKPVSFSFLWRGEGHIVMCQGLFSLGLTPCPFIWEGSGFMQRQNA